MSAYESVHVCVWDASYGFYPVWVCEGEKEWNNCTVCQFVYVLFGVDMCMCSEFAYL